MAARSCPADPRTRALHGARPRASSVLLSLGVVVALLALAAPAAAAFRVGAPVVGFHSHGRKGSGKSGHHSHGGADPDPAPPAPGPPPPPTAQCFPWTATASIAREAFEYPAATDGARRKAERGALIDMQCDSVICPPPAVANCYMKDGVCGTDEWCLLEDEVKFGPWAMGIGGETPDLKSASCSTLRAGNYSHLFDKTCGGRDQWGPWLAVRGRCVKYRGLDQSCNSYIGGGGGSEPHYAVDLVKGAPPPRPLLCEPGLVCTGDVQPVPHTCITARPRDICYQGAWWDSTTWCKRPGSRGLTRDELEDAAVTLALQLPAESFSPFSPAYWHEPAAERARAGIQDILQTLWPDRYRANTKFPLKLPRPAGQPGSREWNETAAAVLKRMHQANKVWSTIHMVIHNARSPMSRKQVEASRGLAVWLRQTFFCSNCRGFWSADVLDAISLPPDTTERHAHADWWWRAHNMASEHSAATRGGHPWIYPPFANDADFEKAFGGYSPLLKCQNPWFLRLEDAYAMWSLDEDGDDDDAMGSAGGPAGLDGDDGGVDGIRAV